MPEDPVEGQGDAGNSSGNVSSGSGSSSSGGGSSGGSGGSVVTDPNVDTTLHPVISIVGIAGNGAVRLNWNAVANADSYDVYYSPSVITDTTDLSRNPVQHPNGNSPITTTTYTVNGLNNNTVYYFSVVANSGSATSLASATSITTAVGPVKSVTPKSTAFSAAELAQFTDTRELNDTGVQYAISTTTHLSSCTAGDLTSTEQDCNHGRDSDSRVNAATDGVAGFSFTKINSQGSGLKADADDWDCVLDNVTGLMWQVKRNGDGAQGRSVSSDLHDADDQFTWYSSSVNSAYAGLSDGSTVSGINANTCYDYSSSSLCNTEAYTARVNAARLCGYNNWRLPSAREFLSIVSYNSRIANNSTIALDASYFPLGTSSLPSRYWTSSHYYPETNHAWVVDLRDNSANGQNMGRLTHVSKNQPHGVILVRSAY